MNVLCECTHQRLVHHSGLSKTYGRSCGMEGCDCSGFTPLTVRVKRERKVKALDRTDQKLFS